MPHLSVSIKEPIENDDCSNIVMDSALDIKTTTIVPETQPQFAEPEPEPPEPQLGRFHRARMIPQHLYNYIPSKAASAMSQYQALKPSPLPPTKKCQKSPSPMLESSLSPEPTVYVDTIPDEFSMFKRYKDMLPSTCPDDATNLDSVADAPAFDVPPDPSTNPDPASIYSQHTGGADFSEPSSSQAPWFSPFLNASICCLMWWFYPSTTKTLGDLNWLVHEVILMPDFKKLDLDGFDAAWKAGWLDEPEHSTTSPFQRDGWTEDFVTMCLLPPNTHLVPENGCPEVQSPNIWHCSLIDIIWTAFKDLQFNDFHIKGFMQMWNPPGCPQPEQIYGEVYTSEAFLEMEDSIKPFPGCNLEAVIAPIMVYSDSTHLANFSDAALWPAYVLLGLLSKYIQAKVTSFSHPYPRPKLTVSAVAVSWEHYICLSTGW